MAGIVNNVAKTCQVFFFFYIPCTHTNRSNSSGQIYVKERHRLQTVHWQSIIEIQPGK